MCIGLGTWYLVFGIGMGMGMGIGLGIGIGIHSGMNFGIWYLVFGIWYLVFGAWYWYCWLCIGIGNW